LAGGAEARWQPMRTDWRTPNPPWIGRTSDRAGVPGANERIAEKELPHTRERKAVQNPCGRVAGRCGRSVFFAFASSVRLSLLAATSAGPRGIAPPTPLFDAVRAHDPSRNVYSHNGLCPLDTPSTSSHSAQFTPSSLGSARRGNLKPAKR
jgi:hypothetical protein